jgi:hypothetical protein
MATRGRPFEPGNKIGRGRPKGSRNKVTREGREILNQYFPSLLRKAIFMALQGDTRMLSMLLKLGLDQAPAPFKFGKVPVQTTDDLMKFSEIVMEYLAAGKISAQEAKEAHDAIDGRRKLIEVHEFGKRLGKMEEKQHGNPPEDKAA